MGRKNANGPVSSISDLESLDSDIPFTLGSSAQGPGGSVFMIRGSSARRRESDYTSEEKYLSLGIEEINDDNKQTDAGKADYWVPEKEDGKQSKRPYKREALDKSMASALKKGFERRDVLLSSLKLMGITAFIIDSQHATTVPEIMEHVHRVITFVGKENRTFAPTAFQRCLLYQDREGLLYNLVMPPYSAGLASKWQEYVDGFSAFQATIAFTTLLRSLPCAQEGT